MVFASLDTIDRYFSLNPFIEKAIDFFRKGKGDSLAAGMHEPAELFPVKVSVSEGLTRNSSEGFLEYHRKYVDLQIVVSGMEQIGVAPLSECSCNKPFDSEKDFGVADGGEDCVTLSPGRFVLLFPEDAHNPSCSVNEVRQMVRKLVFKIPVV